MWKYKRLKDKSKPETKNFGFFVFKFFDILKWPGGEMVKRGRLKICYPRGETVSVRIRLGLQNTPLSQQVEEVVREATQYEFESHVGYW